jgi:imidazole glycerol-phosphate synthase subunit HisF
LRTRIIPCLLLRGSGLVKTVRFRKPSYVGDPINAVRIFNDKEVDELILLDIQAHQSSADAIQYDRVAQIAGECFMPLAYGGGIRTTDQMRRLYSLGVEKVVLNTAAYESPELISAGAALFGISSIVVSIDIKRTLTGYAVYTHGGSRKRSGNMVSYARECARLGAGELMANSIDRDGTMAGFDVAAIRKIADEVSVPVIACGGAGRLEDFVQAVREGRASAVAAGSLFVFHGPHRAVLINYPRRTDIEAAFQ